ncbi:MAG: ribose transport system substrate-binding protein [Kosmotogales bacterium]|nr:ribose transport system substrate-binding protein [Kosmotogales bacterium]
MKGLAFILIVLSLAVFIFGEVPVIGISVIGAEHDWDINAYNGAVAKAKELGAEVIAFDGERKPEKQLNDVKTLISKDVNALIVILGYTDVIEPELRIAREKGIVVVTADFRSVYSQCNVSTNNMTAMIDQALRLVTDLKGEGEIGIFYRPGNPVSELRKKCLDLVLSEYPNVKIVAEEAYIFPGTVPDAYNKTKDMLRAHPEIDAFWSIFDMPMIGAAQAIDDLGADAKCYGFDGDPTAMKMILDPESSFAVTIAQQPYIIGETCAEVAMNLLNGAEVPVMEFVPHVLVAEQNVQEVLNTLGQYQ